MAVAELPRRDRADGRVPPHNLDAEESLLGAMLLSRDAIVSATEVGLGAEEFYKPAHGHVYDAITSLYAAGEPADPVTVAEELRRAGLLEAIGGPALLLTLQAGTPATSNAGRYARIINEHALLRRLIGVAGEIAELGYSLPDDVVAAVDRAESLVFDVAQRRVTDSTRPIKELLDASLDRLEMLYEKGDSITGLPTGYNGLDEIMSGLQPSSLVIVGARPATGKCLTGDTVMHDPLTGERLTLAEMYRRGAAGDDITVTSIGDDRQLRLRRPSHVVDDGVRPVYRVRTRLGREVRTTMAHPFLTPTGWRPLADLAVGARIAVPRELPIFGDDELVSDAEVALLASGAESVPDVIFRSPRRQVALFLNRLFACDGTTNVSVTGERVTAYSGVSERLLRDVQHLLLRFGCNARLRRRVVIHRGIRQPGWELQLVDAAEQARFRAEISDLSSKAAGRPISHNWHVGTRMPRRETIGALATVLDDPTLRLWAESAIYWDEVVALEADGEEQVYDLTVPGDHNFVAADVFVHNTAFALGMAAHAALEVNRPVLFFSLEMSHLEITQRILSAEARVESTKMRNGKLSESDWSKISHAIGRLAEAPLFIDDDPQTTVMEIRSKARRLKSREGDLALVVVDYLQLMSGRTSAENRQVEVSEISRGLKILARELEIPVVALSQLSRQLEMRADKRPMLADLRESGSLEQDADVVMFLYRDELYNTDSPDRGTAEVLVSKHRSGPTGMDRLAFLDHYTRFANMARGM